MDPQAYSMLYYACFDKSSSPWPSWRGSGAGAPAAQIGTHTT